MASYQIVHVEIPSRDYKESDVFYAQVFGWKITVDQNFNYHQFAAEPGPGGGFVSTTERDPSGNVLGEVGKPLIYLGSDDIDADLAKIVQHGGSVVAPKSEIPGIGWFAIFTDPTGNRLALYTSANPQSGS
ncbi:MAG: VOC family protein [Chloroflexi bacterium]|nr:VOC family protein [Chloroflexota bacterium]